ncbi:hypothetical protein BGZ60DRAFT_410615 [Tricladium varicosporioides]|nr:hypothetical protein BGZ60DRAFT_410615 [Hymenoscyphus varicosporioides]
MPIHFDPPNEDPPIPLPLHDGECNSAPNLSTLIPSFHPIDPKGSAAPQARRPKNDDDLFEDEPKFKKFIDAIVNLIKSILSDDAKLSAFTIKICTDLIDAYPSKNVMVVAEGVNHVAEFSGVEKRRAECPITFGSWGYTIYLFDGGRFDLQGVGGYRNWCFNGNYTRSGNHVDFSPRIADVPGSEAVYVCNAIKNGVEQSLFAYYKDWKTAGNGRLPDSHVTIKNPGTVLWEGNTWSGRFGDGNVFTCSVDKNGDKVPNGSIAGTSKNSFHGFTLRKDWPHVLYSTDGWAVTTLYYCI